jgi:hypothetical protein
MKGSSVLKLLLLILALGSLGAAEKVTKDKAGKETPAVAKNPKLSGLPSGGILDLGELKATDPAGEPKGRGRILTDYSGMAYDPKRHRMLLFGGGHASTNYDGIVALNLKDLTWSEEYPPTPISAMVPDNYDAAHGAWKKGPAGPYPRPAARHTVDLLAVVDDEFITVTYVEGNGPGLGGGWVGADSTHWVGGGCAAHYDLEKKTWVFGTGSEYTWPGSAVDPKTGNIVTLGQKGMHVYDVKKRALSVALDGGHYLPTDETGARVSAGDLSYNISLTYFPPDDSFYLITTAAVFRLRYNRENPGASIISRVATTGTHPPERVTQFAYDPTSKIIGGGPLNSTFYAFDPNTKAWQSKQLSVPGQRLAWMALDFDPVDNVFIFVSEWNSSGGHAYAFKW